jgi:hypothetical protein
MTGKELEKFLKWKNRRDVERAKMTYADRQKARRRHERDQKFMRIALFVGGMLCGTESLTEIALLICFGVLCPIAMRYDML